MKPGHLIAYNTLVSYCQSLVALVVNLFTARWVLQALGAVDYGLFGVVGSILLLVTFLNTALTLGVARYYAYAIGKGKTVHKDDARDDLTRWFNTAMSTHCVIGALILLTGWPIGEYAIGHWLNIPPDRVSSCLVVYRYAMANTFVSVLSVPFTAMFAAHQAIAQASLIRILQSLLIFALSWTLLHVQSDRLTFYAAGYSLISIGTSFALIVWAIVSFDACRPRVAYFFNQDYFVKLFSYVGWKIFGTGCVVLRNGGVPVLVNLYFGLVMNAAFNIANRVSVQSTTLSASMQSAFQPAIVAAEGMGNRLQMIAMSLRVCRFGSLLVLIFIVPLALEMQTVLDIWLKEPPEYTAELCRWMLGMLVLDRMTAGHMIAVNAQGRIAIYELIQGLTFLLALPILWILNSRGVGPAVIGISLFASQLVYCIGRLAFAKALVAFPITPWIRTVALPVLLIIGAPAGFWLLITHFLNPGLLRFVGTIVVTGSIVCFLGGFALTVPDERREMMVILRKAWEKASLLPKAVFGKTL